MALFSTGQVVTAAQLNLLPVRYELTGVVGSVVTVCPAGSISTFRSLIIAVWNSTSNTAVSSSNPSVKPTDGNTTITDGGGNTVVIGYPADGSVTAQRTAGTATHEVHILLI